MNTSWSTNELRLDHPFKDAPDVGPLWTQLGEIENEIAKKLMSRPKGTVLVLDEQGWMLKDDGQYLVLVHGHWSDGHLACLTSRFDMNLEWVDIEEYELCQAIGIAQNALWAFDELVQQTLH